MKSVLCALTLLLAAVSTPADVMFFQHVGTGSGTLNGVPFSSRRFAIAAEGNTASRDSFIGGFSIDHTQALISLTGMGDFQILTPTRTFVSNSGNLVGFSRAGVTGNDLFNGPSNLAFGTWDMLSGIGPINGGGGLLQWGLAPQISTSAGILIFDDGATDATFSAAVPEPTTLALLGLAGLGLKRRRR